MKAVLISINPKRCAEIASGEKTIEIRKTATKIETPFKCYIYCTLPPKEELFTHSGIGVDEFMSPRPPQNLSA